jgi:uncharacterized surface protein with fasciclin (FAS1) repeats
LTAAPPALPSAALSSRVPATLEDEERLSSPAGNVTVSVNGGTVIFEDAQAREATVVEADIRAANGVIHRVDGAFLSQ